jgi:hypothetical protein
VRRGSDTGLGLIQTVILDRTAESTPAAPAAAELRVRWRARRHHAMERFRSAGRRDPVGEREEEQGNDLRGSGAAMLAVAAERRRRAARGRRRARAAAERRDRGEREAGEVLTPPGQTHGAWATAEGGEEPARRRPEACGDGGARG